MKFFKKNTRSLECDIDRSSGLFFDGFINFRNRIIKTPILISDINEIISPIDLYIVAGGIRLWMSGISKGSRTLKPSCFGEIKVREKYPEGDIPNDIKRYYYDRISKGLIIKKEKYLKDFNFRNSTPLYDLIQYNGYSHTEDNIKNKLWDNIGTEFSFSINLTLYDIYI